MQLGDLLLCFPKMRLVGRAHVSAETVRNETNHHRERRRDGDGERNERGCYYTALACFPLRLRAREDFHVLSNVFRRLSSVRSFPTESHGRNRWEGARLLQEGSERGSQPERCSPSAVRCLLSRSRQRDRMPTNCPVLCPREGQGHTCFSRSALCPIPIPPLAAAN